VYCKHSIKFCWLEVTWIDKFDGSGVNWDNWTAQVQANYNNAVQCYTDDETSDQRNYKISDGSLKITARKQDISCLGLGGENKSWTSGFLNSEEKLIFYIPVLKLAFLFRHRRRYLASVLDA
jgi:hypothetical protein